MEDNRVFVACDRDLCIFKVEMGRPHFCGRTNQGIAISKEGNCLSYEKDVKAELEISIQDAVEDTLKKHGIIK